MSTANQYVPADVSHNDLLRYHLEVSNKVDRENEKRDALKVLAKLDNPAVHPIHQHAQISHDEQKHSVNPSNAAVVARVKKDAATVKKAKHDTEVKADENENFKHLSNEEVAANLKNMEAQVKTAANRQGTLPAWNPTVVAEKPVEAAKSNNPVVPNWAG